MRPPRIPTGCPFVADWPMCFLSNGRTRRRIYFVPRLLKFFAPTARSGSIRKVTFLQYSSSSSRTTTANGKRFREEWERGDNEKFFLLTDVYPSERCCWYIASERHTHSLFLSLARISTNSCCRAHKTHTQSISTCFKSLLGSIVRVSLLFCDIENTQHGFASLPL
jgi:hypothetical protein